MNKKGFTVIELITTFSLVTVIIIILVNVILIIKKTYSENEIRTNLLIEQGNLSSVINKKFSKDNLLSYQVCNDSTFCYTFEFNDGTTSKLIVYDDYIQFDNYIYKMKRGSKIGESTFTIDNIDVSNVNINNSILLIKIPINNKLYPNQDFGVNIIYQYNSNKIEL